MPLSSTGIAEGQEVDDSHVKQFFDLLTGIMEDQPVTLKNTLSVGGKHASNTAAFKIYGAESQSADLLQIFAFGDNVTPVFSIGSSGILEFGGAIALEEIATPEAPAAGAVIYSKAGGGLFVRSVGGSEEAAVTESATQTLTNKTLTGPAFTSYLDVAEIEAPTDPAAGTRRLYMKDDGQLYSRDSAGVESPVGEGELFSTVATATADQTAFTVPSNRKITLVVVNSLPRDAAQWTRTNETTLTFASGLVEGDEVWIKYVAS